MRLPNRCHSVFAAASDATAASCTSGLFVAPVVRVGAAARWSTGAVVDLGAAWVTAAEVGGVGGIATAGGDGGGARNA